MVSTSGQQQAALQALHHWLKAQWPIKQVLPAHVQKQLAHICQQIYQHYQYQDFNYPDKQQFHSESGFQQDQFHSGLLYMGAQTTTPLHDHANSFSLSLLLSGDVSISIYHHTENHHNHISELVFEEKLHLQPGHFTHLAANNLKAHKLSTTTQTACLLDVHYPLFSMGQRYWYLPVMSSDDKHLSCQRVSESKFST